MGLIQSQIRYYNTISYGLFHVSEFLYKITLRMKRALIQSIKKLTQKHSHGNFVIKKRDSKITLII